MLPSLTRTTSDDDLLSTDVDDGSLDDPDTDTGLQYFFIIIIINYYKQNEF